MIRISEIFHSVQGEGIELGKPSIFVRVSGCNLKCRKATEGFDCDSAYHIVGNGMENKDIIKEIKEYPCKHIIWTGGEPCLQQTEIKKIMQKLGSGYTHSLETNGVLNFEPRWFVGGIMNISPKKQNIVTEQLKKYAQNNKCYFKFVIKSAEDFAFWMSVVYDIKAEHSRVYMMPCGTDSLSLNKISRELIEDCKEHNVNFTPRMHIDIYGNEQGK